MLKFPCGVALIASLAASPVIAQDAPDTCTLSLQALAKAAQTAHVAAALAAKAAAQLDETQAIFDQCRLRPHDKKHATGCQNIATRLKDAERASEAAEDELDATLDEVDAAYDDMANECEGGFDEETGPVFTSLHRDHHARNSTHGRSAHHNAGPGTPVNHQRKGRPRLTTIPDPSATNAELTARSR